MTLKNGMLCTSVMHNIVVLLYIPGKGVYLVVNTLKSMGRHYQHFLWDNLVVPSVKALLGQS